MRNWRRSRRFVIEADRLRCFSADRAAKSGLIPLVSGLVEEVIIPQTVYAECTPEITLPGAQAVHAAVEAGKIQVRRDAPRADNDAGEDLSGLDAGELAAIQRASALQCPALIDERLGRQAAQRRGLTVIGSTGLLLAAKHSRRGTDSRSVAAVRILPVGYRSQGCA